MCESFILILPANCPWFAPYEFIASCKTEHFYEDISLKIANFCFKKKNDTVKKLWTF